MAPAAADNIGDVGIAQTCDPRQDIPLAVVGASDVNSQMIVARVIFEEQQRKKNEAETKIAAIVRARLIEAMKEQELDLARAIRRHHEEEQVQKHLMSLREKDSNSRKRSFQCEELYRNVFQCNRDKLSLLSDMRTADRRRNEDDEHIPTKFAFYQNMISQGASRVLHVPSFENGIVSLPLSSLSPSHSSLQPHSMPLSSSSLLSRRSSFPEEQPSPFLHNGNNAHINQKDFYVDRSQAILNSLYSSATGPMSSNQDLSLLRKYCSDLSFDIPSPGDNLQPVGRASAGNDWLRSSEPGITPNPGLLRASISEQEKRPPESRQELIVDSSDVKPSGNYIRLNDDTGTDAEADQQQKRFNKHQCKQWTLKFHELLEFKERMGHCNVPHGYKENLPLAMWVKRQRHQYNLMVEKKTSTLTGERIKLLENIGFVWNCLETAWEQHFRDLCHFVMRTGHCAVPSTYKMNPRLASWVVTQRRQCKLLEDGKQSSMTPKRLEKLKQIGFMVKTKKASTDKN